MGLYEQVIEAIHGEVKIQTMNGEIGGLGPDAWIEKVVAEDAIAGWQIIAVVVFAFGVPARRITNEEERRLVDEWKKQIDEEVRQYRIRPRDPVTLLPLKFKPKDMTWVIPLAEADEFMGRVGHTLTVTEVVQHLYAEAGLIPHVQDSSKAIEPAERPLSTRERANLLNIIGGLLELIQSPRANRSSEAAIIIEMIENYSDKPGIKKRTLEQKFAEAKRSLRGA